MEKGVFYEVPTGNSHFVREMLKSLSPPKSILTVVGSQWPMFFKELWPDANVLSFDNNPDQIRFNAEQVFDVTRYEPLLLDVRSAKFANLLGDNAFDFLYLSNIPDYLSPVSARNIAEVVDEAGIPQILIATLGQDRIKLPHNQQSIHEFIEWLESAGYHIQHHTDPSTNVDVRDFYLARLEN